MARPQPRPARRPGKGRGPHGDDPPTRKLIAFDAETWAAVDLLARDSMKSIQELADEAFAELLRKHHRPTGLRQALRASDASRAPQTAAGKRRPPARKPRRRR